MSPNQPPPSEYEGTPHKFLLPAGTTLTRIHSTSFGVTQFNPTVARSDLLGGRFDATPGNEYAFLYAAEDDATAISEALLRDLPIDEYGARLLPRARLSRLSISWLRTTLDLELVSLRSGRRQDSPEPTWADQACRKDCPYCTQRTPHMPNVSRLAPRLPASLKPSRLRSSASAASPSTSTPSGR